LVLHDGEDGVVDEVRDVEQAYQVEEAGLELFGGES